MTLKAEFDTVAEAVRYGWRRAGVYNGSYVMTDYAVNQYVNKDGVVSQPVFIRTMGRHGDYISMYPPLDRS